MQAAKLLQMFAWVALTVSSAGCAHSWEWPEFDEAARTATHDPTRPLLGAWVGTWSVNPTSRHMPVRAVFSTRDQVFPLNRNHVLPGSYLVDLEMLNPPLSWWEDPFKVTRVSFDEFMLSKTQEYSGFVMLRAPDYDPAVKGCTDGTTMTLFIQYRVDEDDMFSSGTAVYSGPYYWYVYLHRAGAAVPSSVPTTQRPKRTASISGGIHAAGYLDR